MADDPLMLSCQDDVPLRNLDSYLRTLQQMEAVPLDEYLNLTEELEDYENVCTNNHGGI